jgi:hypothetical protein
LILTLALTFGALALAAQHDPRIIAFANRVLVQNGLGRGILPETAAFALFIGYVLNVRGARDRWTGIKPIREETTSSSSSSRSSSSQPSWPFSWQP